MPPIFALPPRCGKSSPGWESSGHSAYTVGGCVRDSLLSRTPKDWDLCTDALPQQVLSLFADCRPIPTGLAHGTVTVPLGGALYEITTFRTESGYTDSRHPDRVTFVRSLGQDLARRDFTVNAMAYHPREGLCDPFHGWDDLQNGVLRCVGDPDTRFGEDALRILRGLRFAALYHLTPEPCTEGALHRHRQALLQVAPERLLPELTGLLCSPLPGALLETYADILFVLLPELADQSGLPPAQPPPLPRRVAPHPGRRGRRAAACPPAPCRAAARRGKAPPAPAWTPPASATFTATLQSGAAHGRCHLPPPALRQCAAASRGAPH